VTGGGDIAARAATLGIPAGKVDGNDFEAVSAAARDAVDRARAGEGPSFIEALTYRQVGHSKSDPGTYRPEGELEGWLERDPLSLLRARLDEESAAEVERAVHDRIERAVETALAAPYPDAAMSPAGEYAS
jgi:acetoin:2,6-dichlorophenolindophenol oxidoreductase subunit alpha